ncbi:MAG: SMC family ATPase [Candidatus Diapherotrites archaeon]
MIKCIRLSNWRSHKDTELEFYKGTNVLVGIIGAGKSSVTDALSYAFFGTFPALNAKRLNSEEIIMAQPNKMDSAKIELEFDFNGGNYCIERILHRAKASEAKLFREKKLIAGPKPSEVTEKIGELLEIDYELFSRAVYSEQNQIDYFLRLSPQQRKEKFDELLGINKYEKVRSNTTSLINKIKKSVQEKNSFYQRTKERFKEEDMKEAQEKIRKKEEKKIELKEKKESEEEKIEGIKKKIGAIEKKDKEYKELNEKSIRKKAMIEEIEKEVEEIEEKTGIKKEKLKEKEIAAELEKLKERKSELEKKIGELKEKQRKIESLNERKSFLEKEIQSKKRILPKKIEEKVGLGEETKKIEGTKKEKENEKEEKCSELKKIQEKINEIKCNIIACENKNKEIEKHLNELKESDAHCPLCRAELSTKKKSELIKEKEKENEENKKRIIECEKEGKEEEAKEKKLSAGIEELEKEIKKLFEEKALLQHFYSVIDSLSEQGNLLKETSKSIEKETVEVEALKGEADEKLLKDLEEKNKNFEKLFECIKKEGQMHSLKEEIIAVENKIRELNYKEDELINEKQLLTKTEASISSIKIELNSIEESIVELKKQLESLRAIERQLLELEEEISLRKNLEEELSLFNNALKVAQSELREELINTINQAMEDLWPRLYPYHDFISAKMDIEEGSYELKVKNRNNEWVRVEGILSGGERSAAAICIRVAFSLVLAQNLGWLILDEPTHNLDRNAVKELAKLMKHHLPGLVEQIFVITHDPELEKAATSYYYVLERDKANNGVTIPRMQQIE